MQCLNLRVMFLRAHVWHLPATVIITVLKNQDLIGAVFKLQVDDKRLL